MKAQTRPEAARWACRKGRRPVLRTTFAAIALFAGAASATAQDLPNVPSMSCGQAQSLVKERRAVVLRTSPNTYDRFVSEDIMCRPDAYAAPDFERTRDNPQCMIGYYCHPYEDNHF